MKRILITSALLGSVLLLSGCQQPAPPQQQTPQNIHVEVHPPIQAAPTPPAPTPPPMPPVQPPVPPAPTRNYMIGYSDGYHNRIVSIRWVIWEYRQGWELGRWDRAHNLPPRFVP
jgi:hypothetical protein